MPLCRVLPEMFRPPRLSEATNAKGRALLTYPKTSLQAFRIIAEEETISLAISVSPSVCPHGTTHLLEDRFFLKFYICGLFENLLNKLKFNLISDKNNGTLHEDRRTFVIISRWTLLRMRTVSDKSCRENRNTHFIFNNYFGKSCAVYELMWRIW